MKQTYLRFYFHPKLENPVLIVGLPEIGNVGKIAAQLLIEFSQAELFAELYSPAFPDYVIIDEKGVCRPPRYEFYISPMGRNLIILTGDALPPLEDIPAHYEVCGDILDFITKIGCRFTITVGAIPSPYPAKEIYVAATSKDLASEYVEKNATIYKGRRIVGASGLLLGLAKTRGLKGICLLSSTLGLTDDREAAINIYKFLRKVLEPTSKNDTRLQ